MKAGRPFAGIAALLAAAFTFTIPASAHHSFAMFDHDKTQTLTGTVKEFEWANPHAWLNVLVPDANGKPVLWSLEMGSPVSNERAGWKPDSVKPGDKVVVAIHPLKDGTRGGQFINATLPDGTKLGMGGAPERPRGD